MNTGILSVIAVFVLSFSNLYAQDGQKNDYKKYIGIIKTYIYRDYKEMLRKPSGALTYPYITPGSNAYPNQLWDWDSWLSDIALRQILTDKASEGEKAEALAYERGCVLNFLSYGGSDGYIPIVIHINRDPRVHIPKNIYKTNMHKPVLAQHAAFLTRIDNGNAEWLREKFYYLQAFVNNYRMHRRNKATGLYFWQNDLAIGVDNDPCTFFRPPGSSASIYLNCLMYRELLSMVYLAERLDLHEIGLEYEKAAEELKLAVREHCWDERDGFYYSVDINLLPVVEEPAENLDMNFMLHSGFPRDYDCLIQRIGVWSGFMAMWAGIATPEQAKRMVNEHLNNKKTFGAPYGVRTLSRMEKMYSVRASSNPSNWLGPVWGISNYMVFKGLMHYDFKKEAKRMAEKTILLFGRDFEKNGALHEYYDPETGEPILNKGFQDWNYLVMNMIASLEGRTVAEEF